MKIWTEEEIKEFESIRRKKQKLPIIHAFCKDHKITCKKNNYIFTVNRKKYILSDCLFKADGFIVINGRYDKIIRLWHDLFFAPLKTLKNSCTDPVRKQSKSLS